MTYPGFYYSLLGYARMSRNEIEAWDRWLGPETGLRRQQTGLVAQVRSIWPSILCMLHYSEDQSMPVPKNVDVANVSRLHPRDKRLTRTSGMLREPASRSPST
jgi:hypothetical protein